jgi:flagellar biosynthetic protein FliQ
MDHAMVLDVIRETVKVSLLLSAPLLGFGLVMGLIVSVFQAVTQINEATLTFVPKILAIIGALVLFSPWMIDVMTKFTTDIFQQAALWPR